MRPCSASYRARYLLSCNNLKRTLLCFHSYCGPPCMLPHGCTVWQNEALTGISFSRQSIWYIDVEIAVVPIRQNIMGSLKVTIMPNMLIKIYLKIYHSWQIIVVQSKRIQFCWSMRALLLKICADNLNHETTLVQYIRQRGGYNTPIQHEIVL